MRKILLATSALVALAGAAHAAESPIQVTLGGYVDFRAAMYREAGLGADARRADFQTEYALTVAADGKAAGGITYGSKVKLSNYGSPTSEVALEQGYVYLAGAFGKVIMGDEHGASDLFAYAPTVGEGQIDGSYTFFLNGIATVNPTFIDPIENNTKATYYTPKVGNANHKVQLGVSFTPNVSAGDNVVFANAGNQNQIEAVAQYTGNFSPVSVVVTPMLATGEGTGGNRDYTSWGLGAQAMYAGFTLGGSYVDAGRMNATTAQGDDQDAWNIGLKYEFDKVALAANYMAGETVAVDDYSAFGLGATYTWFPGMTTAADAVFFNEGTSGTKDNVGHVLMLSQKMAF